VSGILYLIPIALLLGLLGLGAFLWALKSGQYEDLDGAAQRILHDDDDEPSNGPSNGSTQGYSRGSSHGPDHET
jgi:cbb3-type cytochrome oxidase maturation protein